MRTYDSDSEYNSTSYNSKEEVTDLLTNKRGQTLIKCNPDLVESFNVLKSSPMSQNGHLFKHVLLKNDVSQECRSQSLPNSLNNKNKLNGIIDSTDCDIRTKLLSEDEKSPIIQDLWFNTWPERYEKPKTNDTYNGASELVDNTTHADMHKTSVLDRSNNCDTKKITLNEALQNISLAYSPITKQLHLVQREEILEKDLTSEIDNEKYKHSTEDISSVKKTKHRRTEASSFSSTVSSLSDVSASGSLLGAEDKITFVADIKDEEKKKCSSFFNRYFCALKRLYFILFMHYCRNMFSWKLFSKNKQDIPSQNSPHQHVVASSSALIENLR